MTKTFCDNCGVESTALSHYLIPGYIITEARSRNVVVMKFDRPSDIEIEICPECREKLEIYSVLGSKEKSNLTSLKFSGIIFI